MSNLRDAVSATYPLTISVLKTRVLVFDLFNIGSIAVLLTDYVLADDWIDRRVGRSGVVDPPGAEPWNNSYLITEWWLHGEIYERHSYSQRSRAGAIGNDVVRIINLSFEELLGWLVGSRCYARRRSE